MEKEIRVGGVVIAILMVAAISVPLYFALTTSGVEVSSIQVISTNPGLAANASAAMRFAQAGQNLTAFLYLSPSWPMIVKNLSVATPGFTILSLNASLPLLVDQNITLSMVFSSNQSYSGSVLFLIGSLNASELAEKILIPDIMVDQGSKRVTMVSVQNVGDIPLTNSTAYLVRSDNLVVNSTALPTAGQPPGSLSFYNVDMSCINATIMEIYHVKIHTVGGANASSRAIWFCNC